MPDWLSQILEWIRANPGWAGATIGLVAFLEGLAVVGILVPGIVILFGFGALVGLGILDLATVWLWCSAGAILGDGLSFWLGYHFKHRIEEIWPFSKFPELFAHGKKYFRQHGLKSIIIGRFVGPVRPIIPVIAGMLHMPPKRYVPANLLAGTFWAPAYLLPGVVFGASLELAQAVALRLAMVLAILIGLIWAIGYVVISIYQVLAPLGSRNLAYALAWSQRHPHLSRFTRPLVDPTRPESGSLIVLASLLLLAAAGLLTMLIVVPLTGAPLSIDESLQSSMASLANPWTDRLMIFFSGLGDWFVLGPLSVAVLAWLVVRRRPLAAAHWLAAIVFGFLLSLLISWLLGISRGTPSDAVLGDLHLAMSVVVYGFFAVAIARELPRRTHRAWPYVTAAIVVGLIGFARLYFVRHWASDLLIGALFGLCWIFIIGIAYRRRARRSFWAVPPAAMFYLLVLGLGAMNYQQRAELILQQYREGPAPIELSDAEWRQRGLQTVETRAKLPLNVQSLAPLSVVQERLSERGWAATDTADWSVVLQWLQPEPTIETLPVLPAAWRGQPEQLVLAKPTDQGQLLLRLWSQPRTSGQALVVGSLATHRLTRTLVFFTHWSALPSAADITSLQSDWGGDSTVVENTDQETLLLR